MLLPSCMDLLSNYTGTNAEGANAIPKWQDGDNEAEFGLAWCTIFGGSFYNAYIEVMPKQQGFEKRRDLYMIYHY
ncbi:hypothetical protein QVD17_34746 [Tagetes erecta]|uniref:Uncharacterized protein n=1 Tax=Tagetes erecta TaxID=13708 RepID=A0AAD8JZR6_TARER|nr:hypothetical protein QVD17_34746 [Tagetes erecta]